MREVRTSYWVIGRGRDDVLDILLDVASRIPESPWFSAHDILWSLTNEQPELDARIREVDGLRKLWPMSQIAASMHNARLSVN